MFVLAGVNTLFMLGVAYAVLTELYGLNFDQGRAYLHLPDHQYTTADGDSVAVYDSMIFIDPIGVAVLVGGFATVVNLASLAFLMAMRSVLRPRIDTRMRR